jgi:CTD kinase subunit gamma
VDQRNVSMNTRINILYFLETLCEAALKANYRPYISLIQRELKTIIGAVASADPEGAANVATVKKVLESLKRKGVVERTADEDIYAMLREREELYHLDERESSDEMMSDGDESEEEEDEEEAGKRRKRRFDEQTVQARMEEDRERHKRLRENIWQIPLKQSEDEDPEFEKAWNETSDLNEDDYEIMREENEILAASIL